MPPRRAPPRGPNQFTPQELFDMDNERMDEQYDEIQELGDKVQKHTTRLDAQKQTLYRYKIQFGENDDKIKELHKTIGTVLAAAHRQDQELDKQKELVETLLQKLQQQGQELQELRSIVQQQQFSPAISTPSASSKPPKPRTCTHCGTLFPSGGALHRHLPCSKSKKKS